LDNKLTAEKKDLFIIGGFGGVYREEGEDQVMGYRPQLSMVVYHDGVIK